MSPVMVALWLLAGFLCAELLLRARHRTLDLARPTELRPETRQLRPEQTRAAFSIVCLGDSNTFGEALSFEQAFPALLEALLRSKFPGPDMVVVNAGIRGNTAVMGLERLTTDVLAYRPRIVISAFGANDGHLGEWPLDNCREQQMTHRTTPLGRLDAWLLQSHLLLSLRTRLGHTRRPASAAASAALGDGTSQPRVSLQGFALAQRLIADRLRRAGCSVLFMTSTVPNPAWTNLVAAEQHQVSVYEQFNETVRTLADELAVPLIDLQKLLQQQTPSDSATLIAPDAVHLTAKGHRFAAELVLETIQRSGLLPDDSTEAEQ